MTADRGLIAPTTRVTAADLRQIAEIKVASQDRRFVAPLQRDTATSHEVLNRADPVTLVGSVATDKHATPPLSVFGGRLLDPTAFAGRGGVLLRRVNAGTKFACVPLVNAARRGPRLSPQARRTPVTLPS